MNIQIIEHHCWNI